jgi:RimJ/RimL family protein N-acetyltransferase
MLGSILEGDRVRLVPPAPEHLPILVQWFAHPHITRFLLHRSPLSLRQEEEWFDRIARSEQDVVWTIALKEPATLIGVTGLHGITWRHRHAVNGIVIGERAEWGKGYATETIRITTAYAFRELGLEKVRTSVFEGNDASRRAMERAGFRQCGLLRRNRFFDDKWHDEWLGEILREDWERREPSNLG